MEVLLDSSFVIACLRSKIDFLTELEEKGFKVVLPREVLQELKDLRIKKPFDDRVAIDLALDLFERRRVKKTTIGNGKVDDMLIAKGKQGIYIASLDRVIKRSVPNMVVIDKASKSVEIQRQ
tara:strand:- start:291 stop:656 length:366 start_codon:yes stop_codon:yes gene_type:complete